MTEWEIWVLLTQKIRLHVSWLLQCHVPVPRGWHRGGTGRFGVVVYAAPLCSSFPRWCGGASADGRGRALGSHQLPANRQWYPQLPGGLQQGEGPSPCAPSAAVRGRSVTSVLPEEIPFQRRLVSIGTPDFSHPLPAWYLEPGKFGILSVCYFCWTA